MSINNRFFFEVAELCLLKVKNEISESLSKANSNDKEIIELGSNRLYYTGLRVV